MARNLEDNLNQANGSYVNFDSHRKEYTDHYNALRNKIYTEFKASGVLGKLLNGFTLGGGYGDNLKVSMPDEFDLVIHLVFPENDRIIVTADSSFRGNVILDMTKVLETICNQEHNKAVFDLLKKIVNRKNQLLEDKLQSFLQGVMTQTLNKMGNQIEVGGEVSPLQYKKCGPAHTIFVKGRYEYSVDFVPAIKLSAAQCVLAPEQRKHFGGTPFWDAVPKPMKPAKNENPSFRGSYYDAERRLLHDKNHLKNAIRLLKQHRNTKNNMGNLKSYFIKTIFLWEVAKQDGSYWNKPVKDIMTETLDKLRNNLSLSSKKGKLLFFWDPKLDMIAHLTDSQRQDMVNCVVKFQYICLRADANLTGDIKNNVHCSFSNGKEKGPENKAPNGQGKKTNPQPVQESQKKVVTTQAEAKPKRKLDPASTKSNSTSKEHLKTDSASLKPNLKPSEQKKSVEVLNGTKEKVTPAPVKPNPKTSEQKKPLDVLIGTKEKVTPAPVKPNPKPNEQKAPKGVQPNQATKKEQPAMNRNPNENGAKPKTTDSKTEPPSSEKKEQSSCLVN
ncbi:uncharacterized protein LOC108087626 [Drosophila ficusphila]|uniref:uncharacterized protein LOC108087626 n=1 Tax=Drosophila ficusphila TaxID=30025 RepID=UPI0007E60C18|nr:uncharacterized protein LOC108087626 [Drosophila ficusphila]